MPKSKTFAFKPSPLLIGAVILLALLALVYFFYPGFRPASVPPGPVACTLEAKICPDGSAVGRTGPNCEFAPCPIAGPAGVASVPAGWQIAEEGREGLTFRYPSPFPAQYITPQEWPPQITVASSPVALDCPLTPPASSQPDRTMGKTINDRVYCISASSEGAAGSVYTDYVYKSLSDGLLTTVSFTLRYPQCLNYDDPKQGECAKERSTFDLDALIDQIVGTVRNTW
ncbi:MAG: hypothetical protein WC453_01890 [Patescibacteria group bacterium]